MPRYTDEEETTDNEKSRSLVINIGAIFTAILVTTGIVGALLWLNIFIWSQIF